MLPLQDREFVGHKIPKTGRTLKSVKTKPLMSWKKIPVERNTKEDLHCTPSKHTMYRNLLGQIKWLQSRTQFRCCHTISRCASMTAYPTSVDVKSLQKLARQIKAHSEASILASHTNNDDGSSQRGMTVFLAESREQSSKDGMSYGSLADYESQKIKKFVLSTTVAELYSFMKWFGSCQFLRGLWMDLSGEVANIHMRADAKNLVTAATTIHLPEQKETIHMISMLRKEVQRVFMILLTFQPTIVWQTASRRLQPRRTI